MLPSRFKSVTPPPAEAEPICFINDQTYQAIPDVIAKRILKKQNHFNSRFEIEIIRMNMLEIQ